MKLTFLLSLLVHLAWLVIGTYSFYNFNSNGLLATADSGYYMTVSQAFAAHQGFVYHQSYWTVFPPFYPIILSLFLPTPSSDPIMISPRLHSALFGLLLFAVSLSQGFLRARTCAIQLTLPLLVLASPIFGVASYIWTEELYVVLTTVMLLLLMWHQRSMAWTWLITLGIVTSLAPVTRYIGMVNIVTTTLYLAFIFSGRWWVKLFKCALFAIITAIPLAAWCARNYTVDKTFFGSRPPGGPPLPYNLHTSWLTFSGWFETVADGRISILWIVIPIVVYATLCLRASIPWKKCWPCLLFIGMYVALLNVSASRHRHDPIDTRLLIPIYTPLLFLLGAVAKTTLANGTRTLKTLVLGTIALMTMSNILNFGKMYYDLSQHRRELVCRYNSFPPPSMNCTPQEPER
jgi:hypothetical protein